MTRSNKLCPVCGAEMIGAVDYIDHTVCEEYLNCYTGHYSYEFSYGAERSIIGNTEILSPSKNPEAVTLATAIAINLYKSGMTTV